MDITIRLKHGIHTIFMIIDPLAPFSKITEELLDTIRERYPDGLITSKMPPKTTPIPDSNESVHISYALMKSQSDPSQGWRNLGISEKDTPVEKGLKENCVVAFALQDADETDENVKFEVEWPQLEDDYDGA